MLEGVVFSYSPNYGMLKDWPYQALSSFDSAPLDSKKCLAG